MTRTPPLYTVRWSSQVSRLNNRLGPPTPAPNAHSSASSMSITFFKNLYSSLSNLYQNDNNHCFSTSITNIKNIYSYDSSYVMNIENCNQYKSLTNRLEDANVHDDDDDDNDATQAYAYAYNASILTLIADNKFSCLFIVLWMYNFLAIEVFTHSPRLAYN